MKNTFLIALLCLLLNLPAFADSQYEQLERLGVKIPQRLKDMDKNSEITREKQQEEFREQDAESRAWAEAHPYEPPAPQIIHVFVH